MSDEIKRSQYRKLENGTAVRVCAVGENDVWIYSVERGNEKILREALSKCPVISPEEYAELTFLWSHGKPKEKS